MGKTILDLNDSESEITNPSVYYIETQKTGETTSKKTVLSKLITYLSTVFATETFAETVGDNAVSTANSYTDGVAATKQNKFDVDNNNNDTGNVYSGTLNGESGTILFTGVIPPGESRPFTIGNTSCTSSTKITDLGLIGVGDVVVGGYVPGTNAFVVTVRNNTAVNVANIRLTFRLNN